MTLSELILGEILNLCGLEAS
jgi:hypothetical protein